MCTLTPVRPCLAEVKLGTSLRTTKRWKTQAAQWRAFKDVSFVWPTGRDTRVSALWKEFRVSKGRKHTKQSWNIAQVSTIALIRLRWPVSSSFSINILHPTSSCSPEPSDNSWQPLSQYSCSIKGIMQQQLAKRRRKSIGCVRLAQVTALPELRQVRRHVQPWREWPCRSRCRSSHCSVSGAPGLFCLISCLVLYVCHEKSLFTILIPGKSYLRNCLHLMYQRQLYRKTPLTSSLINNGMATSTSKDYNCSKSSSYQRK